MRKKIKKTRNIDQLVVTPGIARKCDPCYVDTISVTDKMLRELPYDVRKYAGTQQQSRRL